MSTTSLAHQHDLFARLVALGEEVADALDHTNAVSALGDQELRRAAAAIGDRTLPDRHAAASRRDAPCGNAQSGEPAQGRGAEQRRHVGCSPDSDGDLVQRCTARRASRGLLGNPGRSDPSSARGGDRKRNTGRAPGCSSGDERPIPELWDCKWGARGVDASLLAELEDARIRAAGNGARIAVGVVAFDTAAVVAARLGIVHGPREKTRFITLETLGRLAAG